MAEIPTWLCVVAAVIRHQDGRVLMHRRPAHKHHGGLWEFPGGKVDPGETPAAALVRELDEELGIAVEIGAARPVAFAEDGGEAARPALVILLYSVEAWAGEPHPLEDGAVIDWFTPGEVEALDRPPLDRALCAQIFRRNSPREHAR